MPSPGTPALLPASRCTARGLGGPRERGRTPCRPRRSLTAGRSLPSPGPRESGAHEARPGWERGCPHTVSPPRGHSLIPGHSVPPFVPGAQPPLPRTRPHPRTQLPLVGRSLIPRHSPRSIAGRRLTPGRSPHSIVGRSLIPGRSSSQSAVPPPSRGAASFRGAASPQSAASPQGAVPPPSRGAASPRGAVLLHPGAQPHPRAQSPLHSRAQHHPGRSPRPSPGAACSPAAQSIRRRRGAARRRPGAVRDAALSWGRRLPPRRPGPQPLRAPRRRFGVLREPHARPGLPTCPAALT